MNLFMPAERVLYDRAYYLSDEAEKDYAFEVAEEHGVDVGEVLYSDELMKEVRDALDRDIDLYLDDEIANFDSMLRELKCGDDPEHPAEISVVAMGSVGRWDVPSRGLVAANSLRDLKRLYNEPLHKKVEQIESQVGKLEEKAAIYDEMRYIAEHTDPADIRIAEGSTSMTGALMAAAMASYDLSCGLIDDEHIGRYGDVITALEERMGVGAGGLSVQTEAGELIANAKEDGISVGINIPGGKCADIAFVDANQDANDLYPTPVRAFTYNGRDEEPDHRTDVHLDGDMVLEGQLTAEAPAHLPGDVAAAAKEAAAKSVKPDTVGADGIKH